MPISDNRARRGHGLAAAFGYAFDGFADAWRTQPNLRIHAVVAVVVIGAGLVARLPLLAWTAIAFAIALVVAAELVNTAIEALVDLASPAEHPLARRAKDVSAAAVLVSVLGAVAVGLVIAAWVAARIWGAPAGMV